MNFYVFDKILTLVLFICNKKKQIIKKNKIKIGKTSDTYFFLNERSPLLAGAVHLEIVEEYRARRCWR